MSPRPSSFSAPPMSRMVRESVIEGTANAIRVGKLALIRPVTTSSDGRCVATTRWMRVARASCGNRQRLLRPPTGGDHHQVRDLKNVDHPLGRLIITRGCRLYDSMLR